MWVCSLRRELLATLRCCSCSERFQCAFVPLVRPPTQNKPGGCVLWLNGKIKFNTALDRDEESIPGYQGVCYACEDFKAPAPGFTRTFTTKAVTRKDLTTPKARVVTTEEVATRRVTTEPIDDRDAAVYVTKPADTGVCRPEYCTITTEAECEAAAVYTGQADTKVGNLAPSTSTAAGCYVNKFAVLKFNPTIYLNEATGELNKNFGKVGETLLCVVCAPAPAPAREVSTTTDVIVTRPETQEQVTRTDAETTEGSRGTTTLQERYFNAYVVTGTTTQRFVGGRDGRFLRLCIERVVPLMCRHQHTFFRAVLSPCDGGCLDSCLPAYRLHLGLLD
jgi:hypothetical protein